jgi:ParB family chromosome partitioning protein
VAEAVGKDRTTITNLLRILALPASVRDMVAAGHISAGHARALLAIKDQRQQVKLANEIVARQLSVREVESRAREGSGDVAKKKAPPAPPAPRAKDPQVRRIEDQLRKRLQTDVSVYTNADNVGGVQIMFYSADDLERLLDLLLGRNRSEFD